MVDRGCRNRYRFVHPKQGQILLSMPFFLTGLISGREPRRGGPDGCVGGVGAGRGRSCGLDAGRGRSGGVAACSLASGVMCSDVGRVGGITATCGTDGLDGSCSCGPWPFRSGGSLPSDISHSPNPRSSLPNESRVPRDPATRLKPVIGRSWRSWGACGTLIASLPRSKEVSDLLLSCILGLESAANCLTPRAGVIWRCTSTDCSRSGGGHTAATASPLVGRSSRFSSSGRSI